MRATYSPDDDKLRLYFEQQRLPENEYALLKEAGFSFAPSLPGVVQVWTPEREDLCLRFAGEIADEDTTVTERAEARAERFSVYSENAAEKAEQATEQAIELAEKTDTFASWKKVRQVERQVDKAKAAAQRALDEKDAAEYWNRRAVRVIKHKLYLDNAAVRFRRIKKLEAAQRKHQKEFIIREFCLKLAEQVQSGELEYYKVWKYFYAIGFYDKPSIEEIALKLESQVDYYRRWVSHLDNRLSYEKALLEAQGGTGEDKAGIPLEVGGAVYSRSWPLRGTWAKVVKINRSNGRINSVSADTGKPDYMGRTTVKLPYEKIEGIVSAAQVESEGMLPDQPPAGKEPHEYTYRQPVQDEHKAQLKAIASLEVTAVDENYFPTPKDVVTLMLELADIRPGMSVLEPSAGTGAIADELKAAGTEPFCIEINQDCGKVLLEKGYRVYFGDFLNFEGKYQRIVMNPPFSHERKHFDHAIECLMPGGVLVSVLPATANGGASWNDVSFDDIHFLPLETFKAAGTCVNAVVVVYQKRVSEVKP